MESSHIKNWTLYILAVLLFQPKPVEGGKTDAWSQYMSEVRKYKEQSCEEEGKRRPLVKWFPSQLSMWLKKTIVIFFKLRRDVVLVESPKLGVTCWQIKGKWTS